MSTLTLIERRSLDHMAAWVELGTNVMKDARNRLGLSYESIARLVPVSSKTWERWEKRGEVPRYHLRRVADVLELEVEVDVPKMAVRVSSAAEDGPLVSRLAAVETRLKRLEETCQSVLSKLETLGRR